MGRLLDLILGRSKRTRERRQQERELAKRNATATAEHRKRQVHYREVTQIDADGRDTRPKP